MISSRILLIITGSSQVNLRFWEINPATVIGRQVVRPAFPEQLKSIMILIMTKMGGIGIPN